MKISRFDEDFFGLQNFADRLEQFAKTEMRFVDGGLVISLNSRFGYGKSTFLEMWKARMTRGGNGLGFPDDGTENSDKPLLISLNAWESDYNNDPLYAIVSSLTEAVSKSEDKDEAKKLIESAKSFGRFALSVGSQVLAAHTGVDIEKASGAVVTIEKTDAFTVYKERQTAMQAMKKAIEEIVGSETSIKAWFLVDELDRCRPDYAISYLETIKHLFDMKGAVFVLAINREQLESSAKAAFGQGLNFEEYFRKFVHRDIALPPISDRGYGKMAGKYAKHYLEVAKLRHSFMEIEPNIVGFISTFLGLLKLTPRQVQEVFRIAGHVLDTTERNSGRIIFGYSVGIVVMAALKIGNLMVYNLLAEGNWDPAKASEFFNGLADRERDWWFKFFLVGRGILRPAQKPVEDTLEALGFNADMEGWPSVWGMRINENTSNFEKIRETIEELSHWNARWR